MKAIKVIQKTMSQNRCDLDSEALQYLSQKIDLEHFTHEQLVELSETLIGYVFNKNPRWWTLRWTLFHPNATICVIKRQTLEKFSQEYGNLNELFLE